MINGFVKGQELKIKQPLIVADTLDYITARFIFRSPDWNGCSKWVHFKQGETVWDIHLVNDKVTENKHLNLTEGEWEVYIHGTKGNTRITTEIVKVIVQRSGVLNGEPPIEVPPDVAEQLDARIKALEAGGGGGEGGTTDYNFLTNQPKINGVILKGDKTAEDLGLQPKGDYVTKGELDKAKKWQVAEVLLKTNPENPEQTTGTSSLSSQQIYEAYTKNVFTLIKAKSFNDESQLYEDAISVPISSYSPELCLGSQTTYSSGYVYNITIVGNDVELIFSEPDHSLGLYTMKVGQGVKAKKVYITDEEKQTGFVEEWEPADYVGKADIPTKTSQLENDSDFATNKDVDSKFETVNKDIKDLGNDKLDLKPIPIQAEEISQLEAREILNNPIEYEDRLLEFITNNGSPNKAVALGYLLNDGKGNTYLCVTDNKGHFKRFNKETFETFEIVTEDRTKETVALDDLTIDVQGQAGFINSVHNAFNRPEGTSTDGIIKVIAYNIENQLQEYTDVKSGFKYVRLVTGRANQHSFGMWQRVDMTIANAKVGEAVFVKAVDSNNHPTEYETKAVGTGGANEKLTFTGAVNAEYDGSKPVSVEIPTSGGISTDPFKEIINYTTQEGDADVIFTAEKYPLIRGCKEFFWTIELVSPTQSVKTTRLYAKPSKSFVVNGAFNPQHSCFMAAMSAYTGLWLSDYKSLKTNSEKASLTLTYPYGSVSTAETELITKLQSYKPVEALEVYALAGGFEVGSRIIVYGR